MLLFFTLMAMGVPESLSFETWTLLVVCRTLIFALIDTLGEGLMGKIRRLEEASKEFLEEIDTTNIVGTYLFVRGGSRAVSTVIGAYLSTISANSRGFYLGVGVIPLFVAIYIRDYFFELPASQSDDPSGGFAQGDTDREDIDLPSRNQQLPAPTILSIWQEFKMVISTQVVWVHFILLLVVSVLPIGDIAHRELFAKRTANQSQPELIMLIYVNHSLLTYGILFYIITRTTSFNKKHLTVAAFVCLILASPPILLMKDTSQGMILAWSTLFHLLSHLGHSILSLVFFSLYLPFLSARRTVSLVTIPSVLIKGSTMLQPAVERFFTRNLGLEVQFAVYFVLVATLCAVYAVNVDEELDRKVEEALILVRYYDVKRGNEDEEKRLFRPTIEDNGSSSDFNTPSGGTSNVGHDELEEGYIPDPKSERYHHRGEQSHTARGTHLSDGSIDLKHF